MDSESFLAPPVSVEYSVTYDCRRTCAYCNLRAMVREIYGGARRARSRELGLAVVKRIIRQARECGAKVFQITGGEPFVKGTIFEILEYGCSLGLFLKVTTKHLFTTDEASRLRDVGIRSIAVSLDSLEEPTNRRLHGDARLGARLQESIARLMQAGVDVQVAPVLTRVNHAEYERIVRWAVQVGIRSLAPMIIRGGLFSLRSTGGRVDPSLLLDPESRRRLGDELSALHERYGITMEMPGEPAFERRHPQVCPAADHAYITPDGEMTYCSLTPDLTFGSVRDRDLMAVWRSRRRSALMRPVRELYRGTECAACRWFDRCNWLGRCYAACLDTPPFFRPEANRLCRRVRRDAGEPPAAA
jgi:radical SAM protein with 4Fe4S-binding SPASM domain